VTVELANAYWTSAGPVEVHAGREWSLYDFGDRCAAAARAGFRGIGLWHADIVHVLERRTLREIKVLLDDNGLEHLELEFLMDWFLDEDDPARRAADGTRELLFAAAAGLDAHHIKAGNIPGTACELPQLIERYAELCADAAERTSAKVLYEFMPFDVNVHSIETALQVVEGVGNSGVAIDTWHMAKLGIAPDDLRKIPLAQLGWVELSDGQIENMPDRIDETVNHRKLPGEGEFDVRGYVDVCLDMGYDDAWGVEVLSEDLRGYPIDEMFQRTFRAAAAQFEPVAA
jgi:sugar phosphate isomerase/epimerase